MMTLKQNGLLVAAIATLLAVPAMQAAAEEATFHTECRKSSDRGCSGNNTGVYSAPAGKYLDPDSVTSGEILNYWKKQPICGNPILDGRVSTNVKIGNTSVVATLFTAFKAPLHIESGSGGGDLGKVAFLNCRYKFRLLDLPKG